MFSGEHQGLDNGNLLTLNICMPCMFSGLCQGLDKNSSCVTLNINMPYMLSHPYHNTPYIIIYFSGRNTDTSSSLEGSKLAWQSTRMTEQRQYTDGTYLPLGLPTVAQDNHHIPQPTNTNPFLDNHANPIRQPTRTIPALAPPPTSQQPHPDAASVTGQTAPIQQTNCHVALSPVPPPTSQQTTCHAASARTPATDTQVCNNPASMEIDLKEALFSFTKPAIRAEIHRQQQEKCTILNEESFVYTPLRHSFNDYVTSILNQEGMYRTEIKLPKFDGEPAIRNLVPGNRTNGWFTDEMTIGIGANMVKNTLTLPPNPPMMIVIGASHCARMAGIDLDSAPMKSMGEKEAWGVRFWTTTGFLVTKGAASQVLPVLNEILAFITLSMVKAYGNFVYKGTHILMIPYTWDATNDDISSNEYATSLINTSHKMFEHLSKLRQQQRWHLSFSFSEIPLLYKKQFQLHRRNHIIREVNSLLCPDHAPVKAWKVTSARNLKCVPHLNELRIHRLSNRHLPYEHFDHRHLSADGYLLWLEEVINGGILSITDQDTHDDFIAQEIISIPGEKGSYFHRTAAAKLMCDHNLLDLQKMVELRRLENPMIDGDRLKDLYKDYSVRTQHVGHAQHDGNWQADHEDQPLILGRGSNTGNAIRVNYATNPPLNRGGGPQRGGGKWAGPGRRFRQQ